MRESLVRKARATARLLYATRGMLPAGNGGDHIAQGARLLQECAREIEKLQKALAAPTPSVEAQAEPTMADAIAAGDGTLYGAIDYWQQRTLKAEQSEDGRDAARWLDAVRSAEHLCPLDMSHPDKLRWKASYIRAAIAAKEQL